MLKHSACPFSTASAADSARSSCCSYCRKIYEPIIIEKTQDDLESLIALLQQELFDIRGETTVLNRDLEDVREQTSDSKLQLARLQGELSTVRGSVRSVAGRVRIDHRRGRAGVTKQRLTEEMRRLAALLRRADDDAVAGIPGGQRVRHLHHRHVGQYAAVQLGPRATRSSPRRWTSIRRSRACRS